MIFRMYTIHLLMNLTKLNLRVIKRITNRREFKFKYFSLCIYFALLSYDKVFKQLNQVTKPEVN